MDDPERLAGLAARLVEPMRPVKRRGRTLAMIGIGVTSPAVRERAATARATRRAYSITEQDLLVGR
jgi:hypothetical protein